VTPSPKSARTAVVAKNSPPIVEKGQRARKAAIGFLTGIFKAKVTAGELNGTN
jgi:hypothetical protein